jgi:carbonic anhydrase/acetyltransferase-like protein (isoleucine patch superfamily)
MKLDRVTEQNARVYLYGQHRPRIHPSAFVTPGTFIVGKVTIKRGASVWFGTVLRGCSMGDGVVIGANAVVFAAPGTPSGSRAIGVRGRARAIPR